MGEGRMEHTIDDKTELPRVDGGEIKKCGDDAGGEQRSDFLRLPLVWVDCEMTGLDVENDQILEIAVILTDGSCDTIIEGPTYVIHAEKSKLDSMSEWCRDTHGRSGLTEAAENSQITLQQAEDGILQFLKKHIQDLKTTPLAGSSVHVDRQFLLRQMPTLANSLSYRVVDVSSIKELWYRWRKPRNSKPTPNHRALDDIRGSIKELQFYKEHFFLMSEPEEKH